MTNIDGRALPRAALEERQKTIIRMKIKGKTAKEIACATGCSIKTVYSLWDKYTRCKDKKNFFSVKPRGNKTGNGRTLTAAQEKRIQKVMTEKYPEQLRFDFALWTRAAVALLARRLFGIEMPIRTVGEYLRRWGFTPQKPIKRAYKRDEGRVKNWLEKEYPEIKRRAKRQKAVIYWCDQTSIVADDIRVRGYAPKGKTPIVRNTEPKVSVSMISAITNQGKVFWKLHAGNVDGHIFLEFVKRLVRRKREKVFLIVDNARMHHARLLTGWLKSNRERIELYFIPPYSPDLNPDEHVNSDVKQGVGTRQPKRTKEGLQAAANEHMNMLKLTPSRIKSYFKDRMISYAA